MINKNSMIKYIFTLSITFLLIIDISTISQQISHDTHGMRINLIVDASCAKCQFNKEDDECLLAVEINSEIYYVDGTTIDDHGDAHGSDGFCNVIRKAHVEGAIYGNKFLLEKFSLLQYRPKTRLYTN